MTVWPEVALSDICEFRYGKALASGDRDGGDYAVYGSNGVVGWNSRAITSGPTVVIGRKGSLGEVVYSANACWPIDTAYYVDGTSSEVDLKWLTYRLGGLGLKNLNKSAAVPGLNRDDAYRQRLLLPPIDEQRRIATILDQADALRAKRRQVLAQLSLLTQSVLANTLSNMGRAENVRVGDVCTRVTDGTHQSPSWTTEGIPFLFVSNITSGEIDFDTARFIATETWEELTRNTPIEEGDVLYSSVGSYGNPAVVRSSRPFAFQRHIAHLKPMRNIMQSDFLAAQLDSPLVRNQASRAAKGIAQPTVNLSDIRRFEVSAPPLEIQNQFAAMSANIRAERTRVRAALGADAALFASLQSRAFRGEL